MNASRNEHTIAVSCQITGRGYWTGRVVRVVVSPAPAGTGVQLVRSDLPSNPACQVAVANRSDAELRTIIQAGQARFEMVEHLLAALMALEIDNCFVEIDGEEFPGLDGSSQPYVEALQQCGLIIQAKSRQRLVVQQTVRVQAGHRWVEAQPSPDGCTSYEYRLSFDDQTPIPAQTYSFQCTPSRFAREVAPARTFVTLAQATALRAQGLASHVTNQELLVFGDAGPVDNALRFADECARHKTLDLIGDLSLVGVDLIGRFVSHRGGHNLNGRMAQELSSLMSSQLTGTPHAGSHRAA